MKRNQSRLCPSKHEIYVYHHKREGRYTACALISQQVGATYEIQLKEMQRCCELKPFSGSQHVSRAPKSEKRCCNCLNVHDFLPNQ